ncbi:hypothetical protein [Pseudomonas sp. HLS-6 TE3448]
MHLVIAVGLSPLFVRLGKNRGRKGLGRGAVTDVSPTGPRRSLLRLGSRQPVCRRQHAPTNLEMAMQDEKDDTVYCNIRMPVAQGRQLLQIVNALRESQALPSLDRVFQDMQSELCMSIENVDNPSTWGPWCQ